MKLLIFLLLTSCSLQPGPYSRFITTKDLHVINKTQCEQSFEAAKSYLLSEGILLRENIAAEKSLVCIAKPNWLLRNLSPVSLSGYSDGKVAWAVDDEKVILHEISHLLWGIQHSNTGVMTRFDNFNVFATGLTDEQLEIMRTE